MVLEETEDSPLLGADCPWGSAQNAPLPAPTADVSTSTSCMLSGGPPEE